MIKIRSNAKLKSYLTTMRSGKSTIALQLNYNFGKDKKGWLLSGLDNDIHTRINIYLSKEAVLVKDETNIIELFKEQEKVDYIIVDEVQFLTRDQVDQLGFIVDEYNIDCYAFGLLTNFKGELFEGSKRLIEIADQRIEGELVKSMCWCGKKGVFNCKVDSKGNPIYEGDDNDKGEHYEVLCRKHYREGITSKNKGTIQ